MSAQAETIDRRKCRHIWYDGKPCQWCGIEAPPNDSALLARPDPAPEAHQVGGTHYAQMAVQPWAAMRAWMSPEQFKGYLRGNVIKYAARCDVKGGLEDLRKARHYLDELIAFLEVHNA